MRRSPVALRDLPSADLQCRIEALGGAFTFGTDENNAHVQPNGQYHYHGMPEGEIARLGKGTGLTLVAWARDGFPIYARYGYIDANNASSGTRVMRGSWQKKATPDTGRPSTTIFPMGTFTQDYEYVAGSGDLDQCNGRTGVTPEFPNGIYHYYSMVERLTERKTQVDFALEWGFKRDETFFAEVYRRTAPQGHYEIWRKANPNRIYIYNKDNDLTDTFEIDWSLHTK